MIVVMLALVSFSSLPFNMAVGETQVNVGAPTAIFTNQNLTNAYVFSSVVNLQSYDSLAIMAVTSTRSASNIWDTGQAIMKYQWAMTTNSGGTWADEPVLTAGTATSTEQPYTYLAKTVQISLGTNLYFPDRVRRLAKFFRVGVKSTNSFTTNALLRVDVLQQNNGN